MATIIPKKSSVADKVPLSGDLEVGEIAINLTDQKIYSKRADNTVVEIANAEAPTLTDLEYISFDTASTYSVAEGEIAWNSAAGTIDIGMADGVVLQVGQEQHIHVKASGTISDGQVVYAVGAVGNSGQIEVSTYTADGTIDELYVVGIATQNITDGNFGYITTFGVVRGIQTNGQNVSEDWLEGTVLYASATTAGGMTAIPPVAPNLSIPVAMVLSAHASNGSIFVRPSSRLHLDELHDVEVAEVSTGDLLQWDGVKWTNRNVADVVGSAYTTGSTTLTTTASDQVVDTFLKANYRTVKYYVEFSTESSYQATELLLTHDDLFVYATEYATIESGLSLGTISSDISGDSVRLLITPTNTNTTVKFARIEVAATGGGSGGGSSGGVSTLSELTDVDVSTVAPTNNQVLKYNTTSSKWEPSDDNDSGGGSSTTLEQGNFSTFGDAITREYVLRGTTTDATETELFFNTSDRIPVGSNTTVYYTIDIVARRTDATGEGAAFQLKGIADNFSGVVADIGLIYEVIVARDDSNYNVDAGADDTNDSIYVKVTGVAAKTIRWVAYVKTVEVAQ